MRKDNISWGESEMKTLSPLYYVPLMLTNFQTIEINIRDQFGSPAPFASGTLTESLGKREGEGKHTRYDMTHYMQLYENQLGGEGIETIYRGAPHQRGHGIGSFLEGLFRRILRLLSSGAPAVGREALRAELNVMTDTSIEAGQWVHQKPVSSLTDDSPIEFVVPGNGDEYIDLAHAMLSVRVKLQPTAPGPPADEGNATTPHVTPVNNLLHSMFNQVDIFFNQKLVSPANNSYAYRAYIETLLNYAPPARKSYLSSALWYDSEEGVSDIYDADAVGADRGSIDLKRVMSNARTVDLIRHLHCDVFNEDKFLLNGVELYLRLERSRDSFCIMEAENRHKLHILETSLLIRRMKISPGILLAHARTLTKGTAKYPVTRDEVKSFTIHAGVQAETLDNVILGQLPKRVIIGFVPTKPLQMSFGKDDLYVDAYHTLFSGTGIHFLNERNGIDRQQFAKGNCLLAFDLTRDLSANCTSHWSLIKHGTLRVEVRFDDALKETVNCLVYAEFDNLIEVDAARQVITDFSG
ncbi:uncharacterized protein F54H12.2-like [Neodiprion virginianus]|uniref:uncharacterized protein F54H12.2-like n=1 Tax=Neodiprion virginianus TaxID=2961670 RepID=UPI001EE7680B|nr:uncharacterized protein F54H12.2-like [Neodiprion virginianus]